MANSGLSSRYPPPGPAVEVEPCDVGAEVAAFDRAIRNTILPFWAAKGADSGSGLFWERFDLHGRPSTEVPHRLMVQARQVATFAQAARHGHYRAGASMALEALDRAVSLFADGGDLSQGLAFSVDGGGRVVDPTRDAYTHAFALFALAGAISLSGESRYRSCVEKLLGFIDDALTDQAVGGLRQCQLDPAPGKAQNPTMHLLEAYLALHEAWPERDFLDRAGAIVHLVETRLAGHSERLILEHYSEDWLPRLDAPEGRVFEPGHQFEWAWLLDRYDRLSGTKSRPLPGVLWEAATQHGIDSSGFCLDEVGVDLVPVRRSRRLWPHCEGVRAALVHESWAGGKASAVLVTMLRRLNADFLGRPFAAGWMDRLDEKGSPAVDFVPASSLYHLYGAWAELKKRSPVNPDTRSVEGAECQV